MRSGWVVWCAAGAVSLAAGCGESAKSGSDSGSGGDSGAGGTSTGGTAGAAGGGATQGGATQGGATQGGMSGTSGVGGAQAGSGASIPAACMGRTSNHTPGTRIRAKNFVTSEGDRAWQGWHDSELGEDCEFVGGVDDVERCMPVSAAIYGMSSFADAGCSEEIVAELACNPAHVRVETSTNSCERGIGRVHELGATVTLGTVYYGTPGACTAVPLEPPVTFHHFGAEVATTSRVEASRGLLPGTSRVRSDGVTATDGTMQVRGWVDTEFDAKCGFETLGADFDSGAQHCVPGWSFSTGYEGPDCTTQLLLQYPCREGERTPSYAFVSGTDVCYTHRLVTVGAPFSGTVYTQSCNPFTGGAPPPAYTIGPDAPASMAPGVTRTVVNDDPGRLKPVYLTSDDGGCWFSTWFDSERGVDCSFQQFSDGTYRCAPSGAAPLATFSDDACTVEAPIAAVSACTSRGVPKYAVSFEGVVTCRRVAEVWPSGEVFSGTSPPSRWMQSDTGCVPATISPETRYVTFGAKLDPSAFMAGELRVE